MAGPNTRETLKSYALRALGDGVIEINVSDEQIEDRIDDALQYFSEYHFDGVERTFLKHQIGATEAQFGLTAGYIEIDVPANVTSIIQILPFNDNFTENFFNIKYQYVLNDIQNWGRMDLTGYDITRQYYDLLSHILSPHPQFEYSRIKNKLRIYLATDGGWENTYILFEAWVVLDPTQYGKIYDNIMLKKYVTQLIKRQWGSNLMKYEGIRMPGEVTFNGNQMFEQANQEIQKMEEEIQKLFETPPNWFIG